MKFITKLSILVIFIIITSCSKEGTCKHCYLVVAQGSTSEFISDMTEVCGDEVEYIETYDSGKNNNGYHDVGYCEDL